MKNSHLVIAVAVLVLVLGAIFFTRKTEAPINGDYTNTATSSAILMDGSYAIDLSKSSVRFKGEYLNGKSEEGTVKFSSGTIEVKEGLVANADLTLDMKSIESVPHNDSIVSLLTSPEILDAERYPTARFVLKKIQPTSQEGAKAGRYVFAGDLTIRGITKPISFITTVTGNEKTIHSTAYFAINRADWDIKYNSPTFFQNLGDKVIRDGVEIELDFLAQKVIQ